MLNSQIGHHLDHLVVLGTRKHQILRDLVFYSMSVRLAILAAELSIWPAALGCHGVSILESCLSYLSASRQRRGLWRRCNSKFAQVRKSASLFMFCIIAFLY